MSKHFTESEFKCNCPSNCGLDVTQQVKVMMDEARDIADTPFVITSGARCVPYNRAIGSNDTSSHTKGLAVDIMAKSSREMYLIMDALVKVGFNRIGINFKKKFIHVDIDRDKSQQVIFGY